MRVDVFYVTMFSIVFIIKKKKLLAQTPLQVNLLATHTHTYTYTHTHHYMYICTL